MSLFDFFRRKPTLADLSEIDALVAESQELGRQSDEIRERRRAIRERIDALNAAKFDAETKAG